MAEAAAQANEPKKKGKMGLIIGVVAVVLAAGGGGGWYFMQSKTKDPAAAEAQAKKAAAKARVFLPLDPFTVNLTGEEERFAQVGITLEVANAEATEEIKAVMPAVRNRLLLLISSKQARELLTLEGKQALAKQIADQTGRLIGWTPTPPRKVKVKVETEEGEGADGEKSEAKAEAAEEESAPAPKPKPNPVTNVHFSQFIVQ
jgi:flagellar FliL protein